MTVNGWLQIGLYALVILALTKPFGIYLHRVFEDERPPFPRTLGRLERLLYRLCGVDPGRQQDFRGYATAMLLFSAPW
ncbi:MAG TPA: potassium-transporting ATPase subunit KdpA [Anaeromyxobacteraceae bacterium]|nr:potassium-transporting ATPase subunit KdpA [Anaeromyxobacteraceae bacterium]